MTDALRARTLNHYRRHVDLYGPECVLETAAADHDLSSRDFAVLTRFVRKQQGRRAPQTAEVLTARIDTAEAACAILNASAVAAREGRDWAAMERYVHERDELRRAQESAQERLSTLRA